MATATARARLLAAAQLHKQQARGPREGRAIGSDPSKQQVARRGDLAPPSRARLRTPAKVTSQTTAMRAHTKPSLTTTSTKLASLRAMKSLPGRTGVGVAKRAAPLRPAATFPNGMAAKPSSVECTEGGSRASARRRGATAPLPTRKSSASTTVAKAGTVSRASPTIARVSSSLEVSSHSVSFMAKGGAAKQRAAPSFRSGMASATCTAFSTAEGESASRKIARG
mmetsp:Transcript_12263/g.31252  ORF Transcript_12263/g.31252 Transcript_12263/m.31252 type:complete len:225 (+) Transcript_12263:288-962(+)